LGAIATAVGLWFKNRGKPNSGRSVCQRHEELVREVDRLPCAEGKVKHDNTEEKVQTLFRKAESHDKRIGVNEGIAIRVSEAVTHVKETVDDIKKTILPTLATKADIVNAIAQAGGNG
jgi:hypothetical protein